MEFGQLVRLQEALSNYWIFKEKALNEFRDSRREKQFVEFESMDEMSMASLSTMERFEKYIRKDHKGLALLFGIQEVFITPLEISSQILGISQKLGTGAISLSDDPFEMDSDQDSNFAEEFSEFGKLLFPDEFRSEDFQ